MNLGNKFRDLTWCKDVTWLTLTWVLSNQFNLTFINKWLDLTGVTALNDSTWLESSFLVTCYNIGLHCFPSPSGRTPLPTLPLTPGVKTNHQVQAYNGYSLVANKPQYVIKECVSIMRGFVLLCCHSDNLYLNKKEFCQLNHWRQDCLITATDCSLTLTTAFSIFSSCLCNGQCSDKCNSKWNETIEQICFCVCDWFCKI